MRTLLVLILTAMAASPVLANVAPPEDEWIFSPNKQFALRHSFRNDDQKVYKADNRDKPLWSFRIEEWGGNFHVADDGSVVAQVRDNYFYAAEKTKPGVIFRDRTGTIALHAVESLCATPRSAGYGEAMQWHYQNYLEGKFLYVRAVDGTLSRVEFATGQLLEQGKTQAAPQDFGSRCSTTELALGGGAALLALACMVLALRLRRGPARAES